MFIKFEWILPSVGAFNSFLVSGNFCCLLIIFANSLDPDQDPQNVGPDLDPNCFTLEFQNLLFEKVSFK